MKKTINLKFIKASTLIVAIAALLSGCSDDDPQKEDVPELITKVTLTFTPNDGSATVVVSATDPDGDGVKNMEADGAIILAKDKTYVLALELTNGLAVPADPAYDVTAEVAEEGDEHMFFFSWTNDAFSDPAGNGNIDNRSDPLSYTGASNSMDENGLPLGLTTTWTAASTNKDGVFRIMLKHQPELKSTSSDSNAGETDLDISFQLQVQ